MRCVVMNDGEIYLDGAELVQLTQQAFDELESAPVCRNKYSEMIYVVKSDKHGTLCSPLELSDEAFYAVQVLKVKTKLGMFLKHLSKPESDYVHRILGLMEVVWMTSST